MISGTAHTASPQVVAKSWPEFRGRRLLGCLQQLRTAPLEMYEAVWREHGDFVRLRALPGFYFYLIAHPDGIDHVLHSHQKNFRKPDVFNRSAALLAGQGILTSEGETWRRQRRLIQPAFLRQEVATLSSHMVAALDLFIREWEEQGDCRTFDVVPEMMRLPLRIARIARFSTS